MWVYKGFMCGHAERNNLSKHIWYYLSHLYSVYEIPKNVLCRLQNALPFYILHQDKTNSLSSLAKITILCSKNHGKKGGRPKLCCSFNFCLICNCQGMKCQKGPQTCSLSSPLLSIRQRKVSSLIMFSWIAWPGGWYFLLLSCPRMSLSYGGD